MSKKPIIVFEGIEGSGKSYHINYVSNPQKRLIGTHKIYDYYNKLIKLNKSKDEIHFHFHPFTFAFAFPILL